MSLCVAWRWNNDISFASDSCVSSADKSVSNLGIKLASIPVRVVSAREKKTGRVEKRFSGTYGLAFSGSYLAGYVIREVLSHLQFIASNDFMTNRKDDAHRSRLPNVEDGVASKHLTFATRAPLSAPDIPALSREIFRDEGLRASA